MGSRRRDWKGLEVVLLIGRGLGNWGNNETMLNSLRTKKVLTEKHQEKRGRAGNAVLGRRLRFSES